MRVQKLSMTSRPDPLPSGNQKRGQTDGQGSEAILALKPVTFRYKHELDPRVSRNSALVAEDVEKVNPDLVARDEQGKPYTVRDEAVNAMLLNEFLKEHSKVEKLEAMVAKQHRDFEAALADLKGQIQKVSAQLEMSKPARTANRPEQPLKLVSQPKQ